MKLFLPAAFAILSALQIKSQSNLVFSIPSEYDFKITIGGYNSTKPQTWQTKFENLPAGQHAVKILVSRPNTSYRLEQSFSLNIERGYELTYFIIPYENSLACRIANSYTLEQVYGGHHLNNRGETGTPETGNSTNRISQYKGKSVMNQSEFRGFWENVKNSFGDEQKLSFMKKQMPNFYFYTDDIKYLVDLIFSQESKLETAKFAYDFVIDPAFYYKLKKSFFSESTFEDLEKYISAKKAEGK